jgi:hypothetical protein
MCKNVNLNSNVVTFFESEIIHIYFFLHFIIYVGN